MTQLTLEAQTAKQLLEQRNRVFIEDRLLISQWCSNLVEHYNNTTEDVRAQLPPLPGTTAEEMLPSLFVTDPSELDVEKYLQEAAVLKNIQQRMCEVFHTINQEAMKCLSVPTPPN